ncbi:DUF3500 domain-containing protein [Streptomyces sp. NBC_00663]|uniref:DUF3500 domain-containing protein n=1 Tax=Streptomyces sp. NBC_00663 TaxID=2975801 RepID=UPI003FCDB925
MRAWRLGGHHVSLNNLVVAGRLVSTTPGFIGADPATTEPLGGIPRPLQGPEDTARRLARSLDADQFRRGLLHSCAVSDIVSGNLPHVRHGDTMTHMQDLWRGRFEDPDLDRLVNDIDRQAEATSGYTDIDHARVGITIPLRRHQWPPPRRRAAAPTTRPTRFSTWSISAGRAAVGGARQEAGSRGRYPYVFHRLR